MARNCVLFILTLTLAEGDKGSLRGGGDGKLPLPWESSPFELSSLLLELENSLGTDLRHMVVSRLERVEAALLPTFDAMEKNEHGNLGPAAVRYTLHRYFTKSYGWVVKGLFTEGHAWNVSSPVELLRAHVPESALNVFSRRLGNHGFGLRDTAAFASTLESLIHAESRETVRDIYQLHGWHPDATLTSGQFDSLLSTYMAAFILQQNLTSDAIEAQSMSLSRKVLDNYLNKLQSTVDKVYPSWNKTQGFLRGIREELAPGLIGVERAVCVKAVALILNRWSTWRQFDCTNIKKMLLAIEDQQSGCVRLADFYRSNTENGVWQFAESVDYLREQGILSETSVGASHIIVPNYLNSQGNCISSSEFYAVCCLNECEDLQDDLERKFRAADVLPDDLAAAVAMMPSSTVPMNRALSPQSLTHLSQIAEHHGGLVPLHGRLFAQWMHNEYPRECSYPQLSGSALHQVTPWVYDKITGHNSVFNKSEAENIVRILSTQSSSSGSLVGRQTCAPWQDVEELVVQHYPGRTTMAELEDDDELWKAVSFMMSCTSLFAVGLTLWRTFVGLRRVVRRKDTLKRSIDV